VALEFLVLLASHVDWNLDHPTFGRRHSDTTSHDDTFVKKTDLIRMVRSR
jgi:hypothetical protein